MESSRVRTLGHDGHLFAISCCLYRKLAPPPAREQMLAMA